MDIALVGAGIGGLAAAACLLQQGHTVRVYEQAGEVSEVGAAVQMSANAEEPNFQVKTEGHDLKFFFGDHSTHAGNFVFQDNVTGTLTKSWNWPVSSVIGILGLAGDKSMKISDEGVMQITVDSGIAVYNYLLPAQSK